MSSLGRSDDEERRVQSLHQMHLIEREPEPALTATVQTTAAVLGCPLAAVTLIDADCEIFLAAVGIERCSAPREEAFCNHTIQSDEMMVVEDARLDQRFADNPQVTERGVCFYAGLALHAPDGHRIGALSVRDFKPRAFTDADRLMLSRMAIIAESQLTWCADRWQRVQSQLLLNGVMKSSQDAVLLLTPIVDAGNAITDFRIRAASSGAEHVLNIPQNQLRDRLVSSVFGSQVKQGDFERLAAVLNTGESDQFDLECGVEGRVTWHHASVARWHDGLAMTLHDVTGHKLVENQLDDVFALSRDLMCVIDARGRYVRTNRALEHLLGVQEGSLLGRPALQSVEPQCVESTRQIFQKLFDGQQISMFENQLLDQQGGRHWIQWSAQRFSGTDMIFTVGRDVTEQRMSRRMLKQSERFARSIIDTLSEAIAIVDVSGAILTVNPTWKRFAQDNRGDLRQVCEGVNYLSVCHLAAERGDIDAAVVMQGIKGVLAGVLETFEHTYRCDSPDEARWFVVTVTRFMHDRRPCAVISHHNITERKQSETKLQQAMAHLDRQAALVDNSIDGICKCTPDGRVLYLNHAARELIGLGDHDPLPQSPGQWYVAGECVELVEKTILPVTLRQGHWHGELTLVPRGSDRRIPVRVSSFAIPTTDGRGVDCLAAIFHDISREKQAQNELEKARRAAEKAHRARSVFLANMSHKIRTPMTAILGYSDLLGDPNLSPADRANHVHTIRRNSRHLLAMLNDLLDLSNIEAGRVFIHREPITTVPLLEEIISVMRPQALEKGLKLSLNYQGPLLPLFIGDRTRLRQILANLIGNAIEFTNTGGVRLDVASAVHDGRVLMSFAVSDTGVGMHAHQLETLFEPFHETEDALTRTQSGPELTLVISQQLARMMSGQITVESQLGRGSTFTLTLDVGDASQMTLADPQATAPLPAASPMESPASPASQVHADSSPIPTRFDGRVLVAEDGPDNQRLIRFYLERLGIQVDLVEDGRQAMEHALAARQLGDPYRLVLMDVQMPVMDGLEATHLLREAGYLAPIIALTAHAAIGDREKCLAGGCDDYIPKPIDRGCIEQVIAHWWRATERAAAIR